MACILGQIMVKAERVMVGRRSHPLVMRIGMRSLQSIALENLKVKKALVESWMKMPAVLSVVLPEATISAVGTTLREAMEDKKALAVAFGIEDVKIVTQSTIPEKVMRSMFGAMIPASVVCVIHPELVVMMQVKLMVPAQNMHQRNL
jgi:hypothetical protein